MKFIFLIVTILLIATTHVTASTFSLSGNMAAMHPAQTNTFQMNIVTGPIVPYLFKSTVVVTGTSTTAGYVTKGGTNCAAGGCSFPAYSQQINLVLTLTRNPVAIETVTVTVEFVDKTLVAAAFISPQTASFNVQLYPRPIFTLTVPANTYLYPGRTVTIPWTLATPFLNEGNYFGGGATQTQCTSNAFGTFSPVNVIFTTGSPTSGSIIYTAPATGPTNVIQTVLSCSFVANSGYGNYGVVQFAGSVTNIYLSPKPILRISGLPATGQMYPNQIFTLQRSLNTNYLSQYVAGSNGIAFLLQMSCVAGTTPMPQSIPNTLISTANAYTEFITQSQAVAQYTLTAASMLTTPLTVCTFSGVWDTGYPDFPISTLQFNNNVPAQYPTYQVTVIKSPIISFINFPTTLARNSGIVTLTYSIANTFITGARLTLTASVGTLTGGTNTLIFDFLPTTTTIYGFQYVAPATIPTGGKAIITGTWSNVGTRVDGPFCFHSFNGAAATKTATWEITIT
jgi:hypothetical protein